MKISDATALPSPIDELDHVGGTLWIDFVNTEALAKQGFCDPLAAHEVWVQWLRARGVLDELPRDIAVEATDLAHARQFRHDLRQLLGNDDQERQVGLQSINDFLAKSPMVYRLLEAGNLVREAKIQLAADLLGPIAESAALSLAHYSFDRFRKCGNPECELHFLDESKNHSRRWCSMAICGNRTKAAKHYRKRSAAPFVDA